MALEAYRCWIEDDAAGGKELWSLSRTLPTTSRTGLSPTSGATCPRATSEKAIGSANMGFCYDYAYNFMTGPQRDKVSAAHRDGFAQQGALRVPPRPRGDRLQLVHPPELSALTLMAIEGEEGFNEHYWKGLVRRLLTTSSPTAGAPMARLKRGSAKTISMSLPLSSSPSVASICTAIPACPRPLAKNFLPAVSLPNGRGFIGCDDSGGTGTDQVLGNYRFHAEDAIGLKWLFPDSKPIDHVWRIYTRENYEAFTDFRQEAYYMSALMAILFPSVL